MKKNLLSILLILSFSLSLQGQDLCSNLFSSILPSSKVEQPMRGIRTPLLSSQEFWSYEEPFMVNNGSEPAPLTYSFDVELPYKELFKLLKADSIAHEYLKTFFIEKNYSKQTLLKKLKLTEKQFNTFAIHKGMVGRDTYNFMDLNPTYMAFMLDESVELEFFTSKNLTSYVQQYFQDMGLPIKAHVDLGFIELTHSSFESSPRAFRDLVLQINDWFPTSTIHLHVGIPAISFSEKSLASVARAVESKIILSLTGNTQFLSFSEYSSLRFNPFLLDWKRGLIRLGKEEFKSPHLAHNLEIRQYKNIKHGLELLSLSSQLALNYDCLFYVQNFIWTKKQDRITGNLPGALFYLGTLLTQSKDPLKRKLGSDLVQFGERAAANILPELRTEIYKYLKKNKIENLITEDLFLLTSY